MFAPRSLIKHYLLETDMGQIMEMKSDPLDRPFAIATSASLPTLRSPRFALGRLGRLGRLDRQDDIARSFTIAYDDKKGFSTTLFAPGAITAQDRFQFFWDSEHLALFHYSLDKVCAETVHDEI
jgi:hypothetical protein